jgi:protein-S-isoprenylcysteine O-methyltransferase Ste14
MYLALLLLLAAWGLHGGHLLAPLWLAAFMAYMTRFQILPEERALAALFGEEFEAYRGRTRRWL